MPQDVTVAAVDLGASSGRVMAGTVGADRLELHEAHRFANEPVRVGGTLHWDILAIHRGMLEGLRRAAGTAGRLDGVGIDSWAVDYGLLDADGALLGNPVHYRDSRTDGVLEKVLADVGAERVYATTGIQFLPFNTAYQLVAAQGSAALAAADQLLLIPDLLASWLSGAHVAEVTNASTTQLLDVTRRAWDDELVAQLGIRRSLLPDLVEPGAVLGAVMPDAVAGTGAPAGVPVIAVASHDTASAVVGVPMADGRTAYVSCGTWSLVGLELEAPVLTTASREANVTNELGVDGTVRYLRNVMGLWLLQECLRTWTNEGHAPDLASLLAEAAALPRLRWVVDPDAPEFLPPGDMPARIRAASLAVSGDAPRTPAEHVRCIIDSLALAYRRVLRTVQALADREVDVLHIVGGGSQNSLLCQAAADACGMPVVAGPVEAAALGNVLVQARALGAVGGDLPALRRLLLETQATRRYEPAGSSADWDAAERLLWA
ncbi:rhamnulokinase [Motilibacter rhizosphaerae]|uniref:Rhamnulokinase n=1 Tax=Motilibacter rhizosphaerae TaxID=598652 RepID=A0A4Q7NUZ6_9ACTN|nr:rhamnulokinase family protein [Motilibacter rhizosphaerae]RZS91056.1 rhamnulokinase [Motilibacter rhizosphaerae]